MHLPKKTFLTFGVSCEADHPNDSLSEPRCKYKFTKMNNDNENNWYRADKNTNVKKKTNETKQFY